jgi:hypothetical protein
MGFPERRVKTFLFLTLTLLSACSWFRGAPQPPQPPQLIVTGAPAQSIVFVDEVQKGQPTAVNDQSQVLIVSEGNHQVDVRLDGTVVYRETLFVKNGERRVVTVLSGSSRE